MLQPSFWPALSLCDIDGLTAGLPGSFVLGSHCEFTRAGVDRDHQTLALAMTAPDHCSGGPPGTFAPFETRATAWRKEAPSSRAGWHTCRCPPSTGARRASWGRLPLQGNLHNQPCAVCNQPSQEARSCCLCCCCCAIVAEHLLGGEIM